VVRAARPRPLGPSRGVIGTLRLMRALRRGLIVLGVAVLAGGLMRLRGKGGVPPTSGGWRELEGPDFR
jgi:hypothetical protein